MINLLAVICLGFFLGMRHATDPDHVIAVGTIVSRQRSIKHAALIGVLWGLGHTLTIFFVGAAIILFSIVIPPRVGLTMELSVGLMLVLLGTLNVTGLMNWVRYNLGFERGEDGGHRENAAHGVVHSHAHSHGGLVHTHVHLHLAGAQSEDSAVPPTSDSGNNVEGPPKGRASRILARIGLYQVLRPLAVGVVHGLAGSAAVALLVLTTIRNPYWAVAYLLVFGAGTIAGMMLITAAIAVPFAYTGLRFERLNRGLAFASGLLSVGFGLLIAYQIGFVNGLFTGHPQWTPK